MVCHSLLQWTSFCQPSPPGAIHLGWPHMVCLSFIELDKAVVHVIRLASFLWLWFRSVCPLMPSFSAYHLTCVSLSLGVGFLFMATYLRHWVAPLGSSWYIRGQIKDPCWNVWFCFLQRESTSYINRRIFWFISFHETNKVILGHRYIPPHSFLLITYR